MLTNDEGGEKEPQKDTKDEEKDPSKDTTKVEPELNKDQKVDVSWDDLVAKLPEDLKNDPSLGTIKDLEGLVKTYVNSQKLIGKDKFVVPDPKYATQEDYINIMRKLGSPDKPEEYEFKLPEGSEANLNMETVNQLKEVAVKNGVLPWQFEEIFGAFYQTATETMTAGEEAAKNRAAEDKAMLEKEWGQAHDEQVRRANVAFKELVPNQADRERIINDGLATHPVLMKVLANASKYMKEDVFVGHGEGSLAGYTPKEALKRAQEIQGDMSHPYRKPEHPGYENAQKEVRNLYKIAFPE